MTSNSLPETTNHLQYNPTTYVKGKYGHVLFLAESFISRNYIICSNDLFLEYCPILKCISKQKRIENMYFSCFN